MIERFHSSGQSALDAATTVDLPAQFLGNIIRKAGAAIGKTVGGVLKGVARPVAPLLRRAARMVGRVIGR